MYCTCCGFCLDAPDEGRDLIVKRSLSLLAELKDKGNLNSNELYLAQDLHRFVVNQERLLSQGGLLDGIFEDKQ